MQGQTSIKYTCAAVAWAMIVLSALLMPASQIDTPIAISIPGMDKIVHIVLFAVLTFLIAKAMEERKVIIAHWKLFVILCLFGLSTELGQFMIRNRTTDILDLCANITGIAAVLIFFRLR